jgi:hypothetical protein
MIRLPRFLGQRPLLDPLFGVLVEHQAVHIDAGQVHRIRIEGAGRHDLLDFGNGQAASHRDSRVEVARGAAKQQVAAFIRLPGLDQADLRAQCTLHHIDGAIEFARFLALGHQRADTGLGEKGRDAGAAGAQLLGQGALRREFKLEFSGQVLALEFLVLADVAGNHLPDLAGFQQLAQAEAINACVVGDHCQILDAAVAQRSDQSLGNATQAEATHSNQLAVGHDALERRVSARINLVHCIPLEDSQTCSTATWKNHLFDCATAPSTELRGICAVVPQSA